MNKNIKAKALYIHIPFCQHICDYCDFPKLQYFTIFAKPYLKKLKEELDSYQIKHQLDTIYVGGGTPTSLDDVLFLELLEIIKQYTKGIKEYIFECNPESLSLSKLNMMERYGVNRLSIGVESTNDDILRSINRHHTFLDVQTAVKTAKSVGIDNINVDLILGLPGTDIETIEKDLDNILSLDIKHISCYSLTVNPNTVFHLKGIKEVDGDISRSFYDLVEEKLKANGFIHYEISNWAKEGFESRHNFTYWNNEQYYGIGLGASGYLNDVRYTNTKSINEYLKGNFINEEGKITSLDDREYQIMLNLRTNRGIDLNQFKDKFNYDLLENKRDIILQLEKEKLLEVKNEHLIATFEGMMVLDQIIFKLI